VWLSVYKRQFYQIVESNRKIDSSAWIESNRIELFFPESECSTWDRQWRLPLRTLKCNTANIRWSRDVRTRWSSWRHDHVTAWWAAETSSWRQLDPVDWQRAPAVPYSSCVLFTVKGLYGTSLTDCICLAYGCVAYALHNRIAVNYSLHFILDIA